jgi:hypothetical protein
MTELFLWRLTVRHVLRMAKRIYTKVKTAHERLRRGWGIAWEGFGSAASSLEYSNESLVSKKMRGIP